MLEALLYSEAAAHQQLHDTRATCQMRSWKRLHRVGTGKKLALLFDSFLADDSVRRVATLVTGPFVFMLLNDFSTKSLLKRA